jgi:glycerophosphoryl diester phosphodiesterase
MKDLDWLVTRPIAHRGLFDADRPENSLAAFRQAVSYGIPFELDVQLARDGLLVVAHDGDLARLTGESVKTPDVDQSRLQRLRIGSSGEHIPLLHEVLEAVNGRVPIVLDVRRWRLERSSELEQTVAAEIRGYDGELALQSFDPLSVSRLRRLASDRPVGQVSGRLPSVGKITAAVGRSMATNLFTRPDFISYELDELPSRYATFWRKVAHLPLITWTVRDIAEERHALALSDNFIFDSYIPSVYRDKSIS